jgi:hypothetical protein
MLVLPEVFNVDGAFFCSIPSHGEGGQGRGAPEHSSKLFRGSKDGAHQQRGVGLSSAWGPPGQLLAAIWFCP